MAEIAPQDPYGKLFSDIFGIGQKRRLNPESRERLGISPVRPSFRSGMLTLLGPTPNMQQAQVLIEALHADWHQFSNSFQERLKHHVTDVEMLPQSPEEIRTHDDGKNIVLRYPTFKVLTLSGTAANVQTFSLISASTLHAQAWCEVDFPYEADGGAIPTGINYRNLARTVKEYRNLSRELSAWEIDRLKYIAQVQGYRTFDHPQVHEAATVGVAEDQALQISIERMMQYEWEEGLDNDPYGLIPAGKIQNYIDAIMSPQGLGQEYDDEELAASWEYSKIELDDLSGIKRKRDLICYITETPRLVRAIGIGCEDDTHGDFAYRAGTQIAVEIACDRNTKD